MPFLDNAELTSLMSGHRHAEYELDLRGLTKDAALVSLTQMLERRRFGPPTDIVIQIDQATPTSGETLFQPVGRALLDARRAGGVSRFSPLPDGSGFWAALPGKPDSDQPEPGTSETEDSTSDPANPDPSS